MATHQYHLHRHRARPQPRDRSGRSGGEPLGTGSDEELARNVAALAVLARSEGPAEAKAKPVAQWALGSVANCDGVVVTLRPGGDPQPAAWTSDAARDVDAAQYQPGRGPCLEAMDQLQVFAVGYLPEARSWPEFRQAAKDRGITSCLCVPLVARGRTLGALNLYSHRRDAFVGDDQAALTFAAVAASALAGLGHEGEIGDR